MVKVLGVRFKKAGKVYYFDPDEYNAVEGDPVIVETARGLEYGEVIIGPKEINEIDVVQPLKKVIRIATEEDHKQFLENNSRKEKAIELCQEKVDKHDLKMKLIDVEYTFDNTKIIFYFTADGRVDFRELVKDLASIFKMRIELRQIGVRDEAKMVGGIGTCGKSLCCHSWLPEFEPVSIKMAKVQNLSLNPTKISGICGRLMCCLKYENDVYTELRKNLPMSGDRVKLAEGSAIVVDSNILEEKVRVKFILSSSQNDNSFKLSDDIVTIRKADILKIEFRSKKDSDIDDLEGIDEEIKELLEE